MNPSFIDTYFRYVVAVDMRQNSVLKIVFRHTKPACSSSATHKLICVLAELIDDTQQP